MLSLARSLQIKELVVPGFSLEAFLILPVHVYRNTHIRKYIYTYTQIHKYIYTCTKMHKFTYTYTHIHIYIEYVYTSYMNVCKSLQICTDPHESMHFFTTPYESLRNRKNPYHILRILTNPWIFKNPHESLRILMNPYESTRILTAIMIWIHCRCWVSEFLRKVLRNSGLPDSAFLI